MKVLIAPDKFKGTLGAPAAAEAMARGWLKARPADTVELLPISDGGDGFGELTAARLGAIPRSCRTVDAAHRPCDCAWWWEPKTRTAVIEAARANGLAMLPAGQYHPFELDTRGLGMVLCAVREAGARRCVIGIGGSATNDGGFGAARATGCVFLGPQNQVIERWTDLHSLSRIEFASSRELFEEVLVAVDVQNRLLGPEGCTRVYGPQKGLRPEDFEAAERCLGRLADVVARQLGFDAAAVPGTGAAGGLGFGLLSFLGARLEPGFGLFAQHAQLAEQIRGSALVITGEGAIDVSTLMGKGVGELASLCRRHAVPCLGLAGVADASREQSNLFDKVYAMVPGLTTRDQAMANPAVWLERLAEKAAVQWT